MVFLLIVNKKLIIIYEIFFSNRGQLIVKLQLNQLVTVFFYNNSRNSFLSFKEIISINFLEGIEEIGSESFYKCDDLTNKTIKLHSSIQHVGDKTFSETNLDVLDLYDLISDFFYIN